MRRPFKIGVSVLNVETDDGYRKAGISRYALQVIGSMAALAQDHRFELYVNERFQPPSGWAGLNNVGYHAVRKYRTHQGLAGLRGIAAGMGVWFVPAYDSLELCPAPQVAMIHDVFPFTNPEWFTKEQVDAMGRAIKRTIRVSKILLANSESTRRALLTQFGSSKPVRVTPLAGGNFDRFGVTVPNGTRERYVLAVGTLEPRKNLHRLLEAWGQVETDFTDVALLVVGGEGWKTKFESARERVRFLGYIPDGDLPTLYEGAELFVLPSLDEGFGMPVLEAMHFGTRLAISRTGALPEIAGDLAIYFDPTSVSSIAEGLRTGLSTQSTRPEELRSRAKEFTWEKTARDTLDALHEAAGAQPWT